MTAYYNEINPYAVANLRRLIDEHLIPPGLVDDRSIEDVTPNDLKGFTQCHFFAGIGVWAHALRLAGWPDSRPVWTGSCPCQPFSPAGRREGFADKRHLWPSWLYLIQQCQPRALFGEQVSSADGRAWLDLVHSDLEASGYAFGALDLCAASVGAPHKRQRFFFTGELVDAHGSGREGWREAPTAARLGNAGRSGSNRQSAASGDSRELADTDSVGRIGAAAGRIESLDAGAVPGAQGHRVAGALADSDSIEQRSGRGAEVSHHRQSQGRHVAGGRGAADRLEARQRRYHRPGPTNGYWSSPDWIFCRDNKWRPVEPGTYPLVDGTPSRMVQIVAYGNGLVAPLAAEFIATYMDRANG